MKCWQMGLMVDRTSIALCSWVSKLSEARGGSRPGGQGVPEVRHQVSGNLISPGGEVNCQP